MKTETEPIEKKKGSWWGIAVIVAMALFFYFVVYAPTSKVLDQRRAGRVFNRMGETPEENAKWEAYMKSKGK